MISLALFPLLFVCPQIVRDARGNLDDSDRSFGYDLSLTAGEALLEYRWDDGRSVPYLGTESSLRIGYGERGMDTGTRLYLTANSAFDATATGASVAALENIERVDARLGRALRFQSDSFLHFALPPADPQVNGWTLSFRLRPSSDAFGRSFLRMPGAVELDLLADGRLRATLLPGGAALVNPRALPADEWSLVTLAYDPALLQQMRLVVDESANNLRFSGAEAARLADELMLGDLARSSRGLVGLLDELVLDPHPFSTNEALRMRAPAVPPGDRRLELRTNLGLRTVSVVAGATRKSVLESAADFNQGDLQGAVARQGTLQWAPARWQRLRPQAAPPPRTTHAMISLGGGRMFTFGAETRDTHQWPMINTVDTWTFDGATNDWVREPAGVAPPRRCHVPVAYSPDHDLVLLVGGWQNDSQPTHVYNDTWVYHISQRRWEQRFPTGNTFGSFSDHGLVYLPQRQKFLLLRGSRNWLYDPSADHWELLPPSSAVTTGGQPTTYGLGASTACELDAASGRIVLFGGSYGSQQSVFSDVTAIYDVDTNTYTVLDPASRPSPRVRGAFAHDPGRGLFAYFGGVQGQFSLRHNDLWVFDPRTLEWTELPCSNRPSVRGGFYGMGFDEVADRFVLYGGRSTPTLWLDETWTLELDFERPGSALYTFDRLQTRLLRTWFSEEVVPSDASISYRFRSGHTGSTWSAWQGPGFEPGNARLVQVEVELRPSSQGETPLVRRMGWR